MPDKKNIIQSPPIRSILNDEDGQSEKLEEKKSINKKNSRGSLFNKDVNDPSERGHD